MTIQLKVEFGSAECPPLLPIFVLNYLQEYVNCMQFEAGN